MDPLSITASIIAVLQVTSAVLSICNDYRSAAKSSSWEYSQVIKELASLRNVLEDLAELSRNKTLTCGTSDSSLLVLTKLCDPSDGPLRTCLSEIEALKKKLTPPSWSGADGSKKRAFIQALAWPLKRDETTKTLETIGRFKATLSLALSSDQIALTQNIRETADKIQHTTLTVHQNVRELNSSLEKMRFDTHHQDIIRWLSAPDPSTNHNSALKKRQVGTGAWLVGNPRFTKWKGQANSVLWLYGSPGCGKTILASTIIENVLDCSQSKSRPTANSVQTQSVLYYYFAFNDEDKTVADKMICSLITQLFLQNRETYAALELAFPHYNMLKQRPSTDELSDAFLSMLQGLGETFIILDALDECTNRDGLLAFICDIISRKLGNIHLLFTSRRERDIEDAFEGLFGVEDKICIQSALVKDDIETYIRGRLNTDPRLKRWRKAIDIRKEIEESLTSKADGMFRWVECQIDALAKCLNVSMLRKTLASLPKTLDDTYARILRNIEEDYVEYVLKILQWLTFSNRLLQVKELAEVLAVDVEADPRFDPDRRLTEPKDILDMCSSLVTIETQLVVEDLGMTIRIIQGEVIRLAHFSVQEYLLSERIRTGPVSQYAISKESANLAIVETSLAYILHLRYPPSLIHQTVEEYPLARYAAESWSQHAAVAGSRSVIMETLIRELFTADSFPYMNWAILYDHNSGSITDSQEPPVSPLYYAVETGCVDVLREMFKENTDLYAGGGIPGSVLHLAIRRRDKNLIQFLISHGADFDSPHHTALEEAVQHNDPGIIELLLRSGAEVSKTGDSLLQNLIYRVAIDGDEVETNKPRYRLDDYENVPLRNPEACLKAILQSDPHRWTAEHFCEAYFEALAGAHGEGRTSAVRRLLNNTSSEVLDTIAERTTRFEIAIKLINDYREEVRRNLVGLGEPQAALAGTLIEPSSSIL